MGLFDSFKNNLEKDVIYIGLLKAMMEIDGNISIDERKKLGEFAYFIISKKRAQKAINYLEKNKLTVNEIINKAKLFSEKERLKLLGELSEMAAADGKVELTEGKFLITLCDLLEVGISNMLHWLDIEYGLTSEELLNDLDIYYKDHYENGNLIFEGRKVRGLQEGLYKYYYESGALWKEINFKKGLKDGLYSIYYENGLIKQEGEFKENKEIGIWRSYNEKGKLEDELNIELEVLKNQLNIEREDPQEIYYVELVNRCAPDNDNLKDIFEISVSKGTAELVEEEGYGDFLGENFEREYYLSSKLFLSKSKDLFVFGSEIESDEFDKLGGYQEYGFAKWYDEKWYKSEKKAIKYSEELLVNLKNGKW